MADRGKRNGRHRKPSSTPASRKRRTGRWQAFAPATGPKSFERLSPQQQQQQQTIKAANVAARVAAGESLRSAAKAERMDPRTALKCDPSGFRKVGRRWRPTPPGRRRDFVGHMNMLSDQGPVEVAPATRRQRQQVGAHWDWVRQVIAGVVTGETPPVPTGLRGASIGGYHFDLSAESVVDFWLSGGLDDLDDIYVRPEGVAA